MALTDGETLKKLLRENPDQALKILEHDLFGMVSVMQGGAQLLSEDLQQSESHVVANLETLQQIADVILHESIRAQAYLEELNMNAKTVEKLEGA